ncbi:hypothetical protein C8Q72DRAFT_831895 [Fomitopsis betulina]|nr:hypothetical protein C8Q72DRAFT_831895 [Fomitopsis betulina]
MWRRRLRRSNHRSYFLGNFVILSATALHLLCLQHRPEWTMHTCKCTPFDYVVFTVLYYLPAYKVIFVPPNPGPPRASAPTLVDIGRRMYGRCGYQTLSTYITTVAAFSASGCGRPSRMCKVVTWCAYAHATTQKGFQCWCQLGCMCGTPVESTLLPTPP